MVVLNRIKGCHLRIGASESRTPPCAGLPGLILGKRWSSWLVATATEDRLNIRHNVQVSLRPC